MNTFLIIAFVIVVFVLAELMLPILIDHVLGFEPDPKSDSKQFPMAHYRALNALGKLVYSKRHVQFIELSEKSYDFGENVYELAYKKDGATDVERICFTESEFEKVEHALTKIKNEQ